MDINRLVNQMSNTRIDPSAQLQHPNVDALVGAMDMMEIDEPPPKPDIPPPQSSYLPQKYQTWLTAQKLNLLHSRLTVDPAAIEELSKAMACEIIRRTYLKENGEQYKPPLPPSDHPYFPYWLPEDFGGAGGLGFQANKCLADAWKDHQVPGGFFEHLVDRRAYTDDEWNMPNPQRQAVVDTMLLCKHRKNWWGANCSGCKLIQER